MKLLMCTECGHVFSLPEDGSKHSCLCGKTFGRYLDGLKAVASGPCRLMEFDSYTFLEALRRVDQGLDGCGDWFTVRIIAEPCDTFKRVETVK